MTVLIIDPPVGPFDSLEALRQWRTELLAMQRAHVNSPGALRTVLDALERVDEWIAGAEGAP